MPDEDKFEFENYKNIKTPEDFGRTLEGTKYYHGLYLKAVNHPIRRKILEIVNNNQEISIEELFNKLSKENVINDIKILKYNIDFLIKALCIEKIEKKNTSFYKITQSGKVIEYL